MPLDSTLKPEASASKGHDPGHDHAHGQGHHHDHVHGSSFADGHPERIAPGDGLWDKCLAEHQQRYDFAAARLVAGARVLDAGCGVGYGTALLADRGACIAIGVDIAADALDVARTRFDRENIRWIREDCVELKEAGGQGPFDLIVNFENLEHVGDPGRFLDRVAILLAADGTFLVSTPNRLAMNRLHGSPPDAPVANPFHEIEFSEPELRDLLSARFESVVFYHQTLDPPERFLYEPILALLWSNPFARAGRWIQRKFRGRHIAEEVEDLLPPRTHRIVAENPGGHLGITMIAECRRPRQPNGAPVHP